MGAKLTKAQHDALVERVETGVGADDALAIDLCRAFIDDPEYPKLAYSLSRALYSLDAVVGLIEAKLPGWPWCTGTLNEDDMPWGTVTQPDEPCRDFTAAAITPARALLAAALRALQYKDQQT